ncbi:GNAT family N-acetyltransferase [Streptomyces virginiae]|uniref:GNAT family N-acetyltransferase n=1 Tax=Streptomyces virginiae TaxID=1961 RepID=UPI0034561371
MSFRPRWSCPGRWRRSPRRSWAGHVQSRTPEAHFARGLVAKSDGEVIGVAVGTGLTLNLEGLSVSAQMRRMVLLGFLGVRVDRRGEGCGCRLAEAFLDRYRAEGRRVALTSIAPARDDLVLLYRHWGWHVGAPAAGLVSAYSSMCSARYGRTCSAKVALAPGAW